MKKIVIAVVIGILVFAPIVGIAGEKEDLQNQQMFLSERLGRLRAEFEITGRDLDTVMKKLNDIAEKEKQVQKKDNQKPGEKSKEVGK